jgi:hypothetical protein
MHYTPMEEEHDYASELLLIGFLGNSPWQTVKGSLFYPSSPRPLLLSQSSYFGQSGTVKSLKVSGRVARWKDAA